MAKQRASLSDLDLVNFHVPLASLGPAVDPDPSPDMDTDRIPVPTSSSSYIRAKKPILVPFPIRLPLSVVQWFREQDIQAAEFIRDAIDEKLARIRAGKDGNGKS